MGLAFVPGVMTPTEILRALALGCKLLKFFPAEAAGGVTALRAVAEPFLHTGVKFIATGGIGPPNLAAYLAQPMVAAVAGSWLADRRLLAQKDWQEISALAAHAVALASQPTGKS
jgi:2-dehydro-3-deoxyphosphogluconate aldolase/(4S)-4-hydroxy-2-oxoglutarate aldolase